MEICSSCPSSSSPLSLHRTINNHHHPPNYSYSPGIVRKSPSTSFLCNPFRVDRRVPNFNLHSNRNNNNNNSNGVKILPRAAIQTHRSWLEAAQKGLTALALTAAIHLSPVLAHNLANANEFDVLNGNPPTETYIIDDAGVLNRVTKTDVKKLLSDLEARRGYHIDCVTLRKLTSKADAFEFADQVLERWYPTVEEGNNKGLVLLVTTQKEGAVTGGPAFIRAVGDKVLEGVVSENLPVFATDGKYNEAIFSSAQRLVSAIDGLPDPGGPKFQENKRESNYKTRQETEEKRGQFTTVVVGLLVIAFVVPMAQYYAYVSRK